MTVLERPSVLIMSRNLRCTVYQRQGSRMSTEHQRQGSRMSTEHQRQGSRMNTEHQRQGNPWRKLRCKNHTHGGSYGAKVTPLKEVTVQKSHPWRKLRCKSHTHGGSYGAKATPMEEVTVQKSLLSDLLEGHYMRAMPIQI